MTYGNNFAFEWKVAVLAYLLMGITLGRRLDRRMAGSRIRFADYILGPIFLPILIFLSEIFGFLRKAWNTLRVALDLDAPAD